MMNKNSWDKTMIYKTASGEKVTLYSIYGGGTHPIHGVVEQKNGSTAISCWTDEGRRLDLEHQHPMDIIGVWKESKARFVAFINPLGMVGLFREDEVPKEIITQGVRAEWLDQPRAFDPSQVPESSPKLGHV